MTAADVSLAVIGGGPAGLSAAIGAARAGFDACVIDGGLLGGHLNSLSAAEFGEEGVSITGYAMSLRLQEQASVDDVAYLPREAVGIDREGDRVKVRVAGGGEVTSRSLIVATGRGPGLSPDPRFSPWEGRGVIHCVSCDASFARGGPIVAVVRGPTGWAEAVAAQGHTDRLTVAFEGWRPDGDRAAWAGLVHEVVEDDPVEAVEGDDRVRGVRLASGRSLEAALVVAKDEGEPYLPAFLRDPDVPYASTGHVVPGVGARHLSRLCADSEDLGRRVAGLLGEGRGVA